ncbi:Gfo/Idh/MocA family oxidoreductase, partial [bacterium]|nr:Gfo/Idh/MocA family oxidoreductase [bacterium]
VMGVGGRGVQLIRHLVKRSDVRIKYICDADTSRYARAAEIVIEDHGYKPKFVQDFREMLADPEIDAIVNATSDHWHALATIMACQAGKDVYVEKPLSLTIWDGRKMVEAARKYKRIVQVGTQMRSCPYLYKAADYIQSGKLGDIYLARAFNMLHNQPIVTRDPEPVPDGLDYDLWCGPAPRLPYRPGRWWWGRNDFYLGQIVGDLVHQLDGLRCILGEKYPKTVSHAGGVYHFKDGREQPDSQFVTYEYDDLTLITESALWTPYMHKTPGNVRNMDQFPDWRFGATRVEICGTKGIMFFGRHGAGWQVYDSGKGFKKNNIVAEEHGRRGGDNHIENFVNCVRTREMPNADVEEVHVSTALCHMGKISHRVGNRKLTFDAKTETFPGDDEANKHLRMKYREPWVIPDKV